MARPPRVTGFEGTRLRRARREKKLTQEQLALRLKVHRATLVRWESDISDPPPELSGLMAEILDKDPGWFYQRGISLPADDPRWIQDPNLRAVPLEVLQRRAGQALRALRKTPTEICRAAALTRSRVEELLEGQPPNAQELHKLSEAFGDTFALAARSSGRNELAVGPVLSDMEKLDIVLQRLHRLEQKLESIERLARGWPERSEVHD